MEEPVPAAVKVEDAGLAALSLSARIPEFWVDQPKVWFIQFEAIIEPQKTSDQAKYNAVVAKLGKEAIQQVTDILIDPPAENRYAHLKARLLHVYEESESRQIQKLIGEMELGEQKPTQLLRRMRDLARGKVNDDTLKVLWQNLLPGSVRGVLAVTETNDLTKLATIADKVLENTRPTHIAEVAPQAGTSASAEILAEIAKLSARLSRMESGARSRSQSRSNYGRARSSSRSAVGRRRDDPDWLCFYHFRFREKASKCIQPCGWKNNSGQGN